MPLCAAKVSAATSAAYSATLFVVRPRKPAISLLSPPASNRTPKPASPGLPRGQWIESVLHDRLGLEINQEKTSVVKVREMGQCLDFLGYSFRYDDDLKGQRWKYLNRFPSKKSLARARETIRELTATRLGGLPIGLVVRRLNRCLTGWSNYFGTRYVITLRPSLTLLPTSPDSRVSRAVFS